MEIQQALELISKLPSLIDRLESALESLDNLSSVRANDHIDANQISEIINRHKKSIPSFKARYPDAPIYQEAVGCKYYAFRKELEDWVRSTPSTRRTLAAL